VIPGCKREGGGVGLRELGVKAEGGERVEQLQEYRFVEAGRFNRGNEKLTRKSGGGEDETWDAHFLAVYFTSESPSKGDGEGKAQAVRANNSKNRLAQTVKSPDRLLGKASPLSVRSGDKSKHLAKEVSKSPLSAKQEGQQKGVVDKADKGKSKQRLVQTTRTISPNPPESTPEKAKKVNVQEVVDRLHPKTQLVNSPVRQWREKLRAKDYYIDHPDLFREIIYKTEGKPKKDKSREWLDQPGNEIKIVRIDKKRNK
jgi:hypothetical protein